MKGYRVVRHDAWGNTEVLAKAATISGVLGEAELAEEDGRGEEYCVIRDDGFPGRETEIASADTLERALGKAARKAGRPE
jgi:hypothetical protein